MRRLVDPLQVQQRADTLKQQRQFNRLGDEAVVVRAGRRGVFMRVGRYDHDLEALETGDGAQLLRHRPAGNVRHRQVDHRQIGLALFRQLHAGLAIACNEYAESEWPQQVLQQLQMQRVVVREQ